MKSMWDFLTGIITSLGEFWKFMNTSILDSLDLPLPVKVGVQNALGDWSFIQLLSVGGLTAIIVLWVVKLINPLS